MSPADLVRAGQLKQLLFTALSDSSIYSALVPWVLDAEFKSLTLSQHAQERQCLQQIQLQAGDARPQEMQQCVLQFVAECCCQAASLDNDACTAIPTTAAHESAAGDHRHPPPVLLQHQHSASNQQHNSTSKQKLSKAALSKQGPTSNTQVACSLSQPAVRLAKLHGHLLSHLAAPGLVEHLQQLLLLLTAGPLNETAGSSSSVKQGGNRPANKTTTTSSSKVNDAPSLPCVDQQHIQAAAGALVPYEATKQLMACRSCAARYAAKALECCSKLLCCMPSELLQALVSSPHLQHYSPALTTQLTRALAAATCPGTPGNPTGTTAAVNQQVPWQQQQQQQAMLPAVERTPTAGASSGCGWSAATAAAAPGSAGTPASASSWLPDSHRSLPGSSSKPGRHSARSPASARLSGLGLLMPSAPGSGLPARPASAGQLPAGGKAAKTAAVCNREKSRDLFFSILRRASSRLDALQHAQETAIAAAAAHHPHQATPANVSAAAVGEMTELMAEVAVASKQLLLQLAPSNLVYLAELFVACVLQAASTGEALLEPALVMMAEKDPSRFHKLQQRLADRPAGQQAAATPAHTSSRQPTAGSAGLKRVQQQAVKQGGGNQPHSHEQQQQHQPAAGPSEGVSSLSGGLEGLQHVVHTRTRTRPAKHQQQPHILATAGLAVKQPASTNSGPVNSSSSSGSGLAQKRIAPQRHILPTASTPHGQQQQLGSGAHRFAAGAAAAGGLSSATGISPAASSPLILPSGPGSTTNSPLPASCLSPLFALASESPLTALTAASAGPHAAAACSPLAISSSNTMQGGAQAAAAAPPSRLLVSSTAGHQGAASGSSSSSFVTPRPAAQSTAAPTATSKPAAATAAAKGSRSVAAAPSGPHSAPPKLQAASSSNSNSNTPGQSAASVASLMSQHGSGPGLVMLQLMQQLPPGQHVLVLLLHAADSAAFNRALMGVMVSRVEKLLSSSPVSFTAASGLGQQAAALVALGCYCSYLCFASGAAEPQETSPAAAAGLGGCQEQEPHVPPALVQQQPCLDIASMLQRVFSGSIHSSDGSSSAMQQGSSSSGSSDLNMAWRVALAVPYAVSVVRLAGFNTGAALSPSLQAASQALQVLRQLPALNPSIAGFGALPVCIGACIHACQLKQPQPAAGNSAFWPIRGGNEELSQALIRGSCLVDSSYWSICCPGLQQLVSLLSAATAAAAAGPAALWPAGPKKQQQQQQSHRGSVNPKHKASVPEPASTDAPLPGGSTTAATGTKSTAADLTAAKDPPPAAGAKSQGSSSGSPGGGGGGARHTTPLLLAPRGVPVLASPPAVISEALASAADPVRVALQAAFISQYSTDDNPVKMRDVLTVIHGILVANSLSTALSQGLPAVLQKHLDALQQDVQQQLTPPPAATAAAGSSTTQLQGQELARAVHALYAQQLSVALPEALEAAMRAADHHASHAAAAACGALLPSDVPPAAAATAAALVTTSCKASCAQRLLQEVPLLVQSTLADAADDLVRLVNRRWALHARITAAGAAGSTGTAPISTGSNTTNCSSDSRPPARVQPVKVGHTGDTLDKGAGAAAAGPTAPADAALSSMQGGANRQQQVAAAGNIRRLQAVPTAAGPHAASSVLCNPKEGHEWASGGTDNTSGAASASVPPPASTGACADSCSPDTTAAVDDVVAASAAAAAAAGPMKEGTAGHIYGSSSPSATSQAATAAAAVPLSVPTDSAGTCTSPYADASDGVLPDPALVLAAYISVAARHMSGSAVGSGPEGQGVAGATSAAQLAAQQLVTGVTQGHFSTTDVEQELVRALQQLQAAQGATATSSEPHNDSITAPCEAPEPLQQQLHLCLLLAGAFVHTLLCCPEVKGAVWDSCSARTAAQLQEQEGQWASSSCVLPHLTQLPVLLMKAARGDVPVWLLAQLRKWLQAATLGCI